ncbi:MAG: hypothetical protein IKK75_14235 [Clostridia bacterium]|nr:hypothetical protein [Clostridia bacterium]
MGKKRNIIVCVAVLLLLMIGTAAAFTLSRDFFRDVAHLTLESGDYEDWSLDEKRYMLDIMAKYGLLDEQTAAEAQRQSESAIDALMLDRYGMDSCPDDLGAISLTRIAWVEMGPYTDWSNETWTWYSKMMFEIGLWNETNDVDVYEMPGSEAIPPEEAIELARQHLATQDIDPLQLEKAQVIWHYSTHASDVKREHMTYLITFRFADLNEQYVFLTPSGEIL